MFNFLIIGFIAFLYILSIAYLQTLEGTPDELTPLEKFRIECKSRGLILHIPSYYSGSEAYVPKTAENSNVPSSWLERF